MQILKRILLSLLIFLSTSYGASEVSPTQSGTLACAVPLQETTKEGAWKCPNLPNLPSDIKLFSELSDINFFTGAYLCNYRYEDSGKIANSCSYVSKVVRDEYEKISKEIVGDNVTFDGKVEKLESIDVETDFNFLGVSDLPGYVNGEVSEKITEAQVTFKDSQNKSDAAGDKGISKADASILLIQQSSYDHLVKPYVSSSPSNVPKNDNFSLFLAGLITLDSNYIKGYNEDTGELIVADDWVVKASNPSVRVKNLANEAGSFLGGIVDTITGWFGSATNYEKKFGDSDNFQYEVNSWLDIFQMKIWGYYYNFQRRMDIGYDIIATQLFYIMLVWFLLAGGTRGFVQYHLSNENGGGGSVQMTEAKWMKTLSIMLTVAVFFISMPTPISSLNTVTNNTDVPNEMRKNRTIAKGLIRYSAEISSRFGTMISDLGLSAFLEYIVKSQNVYSGEQIRSSFAHDVEGMKYFYPSYQVLTQCKGYFDATEGNLVDSMSNRKFYMNKDYAESSDFFTQNNIGALNYNLCAKAYKTSILIPSSIIKASMLAKGRVEEQDETMATAVNYLLRNQIVLQDRFGWVNTFSVPVSYFLMRNNDMFLSKGVNEDEIKVSAGKYWDSLNPKDSGDIDVAMIGGDRWNKIENSTGQFTAWAAGWASRLFIYDSLPGFAGIKTGIQQFINNIISRVERRNLIRAVKESNEYSFSKIKGMIGDIKDNLGVSSVLFGGAKVIGKMGLLVLNKTLGAVGEKAGFVAMETVVLIIATFAAYIIWMKGFVILSLSVIAISLLLKTVTYFIRLMLVVMVSPMVVVWAFAKGEHGESKIKHYMRNVLILMIHPVLIVLSAYVFVFVYELFITLYTYLMHIMIQDQTALVSLMATANGSVDSFSSYFTLNVLANLSGILVKIIGLILCTYIILRFDKMVLEAMGLDDASANVGDVGEALYNKGEHHVNPIR